MTRPSERLLSFLAEYDKTGDIAPDDEQSMSSFVISRFDDGNLTTFHGDLSEREIEAFITPDGHTYGSVTLGRVTSLFGDCFVNKTLVQGVFELQMPEAHGGKYQLRRKVGRHYERYDVYFANGRFQLFLDDSPIQHEPLLPIEEALTQNPSIRAFCDDDKNAGILYQGLCNRTWEKSGQRLEASFRRSGRLVSRCRDFNESYIDFYCQAPTQEGDVTPAMEAVMKEAGFSLIS